MQNFNVLDELNENPESDSKVIKDRYEEHS